MFPWVSYKGYIYIMVHILKNMNVNFYVALEIRASKIKTIQGNKLKSLNTVREKIHSIFASSGE